MVSLTIKPLSDLVASSADHTSTLSPAISSEPDDPKQCISALDAFIIFHFVITIEYVN